MSNVKNHHFFASRVQGEDDAVVTNTEPILGRSSFQPLDVAVPRSDVPSHRVNDSARHNTVDSAQLVLALNSKWIYESQTKIPNKLFSGNGATLADILLRAFDGFYVLLGQFLFILGSVQQREGDGVELFGDACHHRSMAQFRINGDLPGGDFGNALIFGTC